MKCSTKRKSWKMKIKRVGTNSPPFSSAYNTAKGCYGGVKKMGVYPIKRLTGVAVFLTSLGSLGLCTKSSSWTNPPIAPPFRNSLKKILRGHSLKNNRIGTLQGELSYWKGQKREPLLEMYYEKS